MPGSFFDSNVILYMVSNDARKAARAREIVDEGGRISVQVLNEIANVGRRKMRMSWEELDVLLSSVRSLLRVDPVTIETHVTGLTMARRYQLPTYDAMIVAAAFLGECDRLWTEDLQHGMKIAGKLAIANPFYQDT